MIDELSHETGHRLDVSYALQNRRFLLSTLSKLMTSSRNHRRGLPHLRSTGRPQCFQKISITRYVISIVHLQIYPGLYRQDT